MREGVNTVVIGCGQAGLAMSYLLTQQRCEHVVLEKRSEIAEIWSRERWDSFTLNTPNSMGVLPGWPYQGTEPDGFGSREYVVSLLRSYASNFNPPVRFNVRVLRVDAVPGSDAYTVTLESGDSYLCRNVVVAAGAYHSPYRPAVAQQLPSSVWQLHSSEYRNPSTLPDGAVLVVGSADSGCQIAEDLHDGGREVFLCVSPAGRRPRRYRGKDMGVWSRALNNANRGTPGFVVPGAHQTSGTKGGHTINLHQFANDGVRLLGRLLAADGDNLSLAQDVGENLARADANCAAWKKLVDEYILSQAIDAPPPEPDPLDEARSNAGERAPPHISLGSEGITGVVWATGFSYDFTWVHLPVLDERGFPVQDRGLTSFPGLYFLGVQGGVFPGTLFSVTEPATTIADAIGKRS